MKWSKGTKEDGYIATRVAGNCFEGVTFAGDRFKVDVIEPIELDIIKTYDAAFDGFPLEGWTPVKGDRTDEIAYRFNQSGLCAVIYFDGEDFCVAEYDDDGDEKGCREIELGY